MTTKLMKIATMLLGVCLLAGCSQEEHLTDPGTGSGENDGVTIALNIPTPVTVGTYAMTGKQECDIMAIDVLVFDPDGKFLYREAGTGISDGGTENKKYFSVKIKKTSDPTSVTAFVYANARNQIDDALANGTGWLTAGITTKAEVIEKLVFDLPVDQTSEDQGGKWLVLPGRYTRFPMWGQTATIDLTLPSVTIPEVTMIRAVAKIDVGLSFPVTGTEAEKEVAAGLSNFYLEEFYLYNAYDKLQVAPTLAHLSGTTVTSPSIPNGTEVFHGAGNADNPITYSRRSYNAEGYKSFMNEIYLAEHPSGSASDRPNNPCIVVGGRFGSQTAAITYYRIDLAENIYGDDGQGNTIITGQNYLPVLRNHRYKVNITAVHERGYDTPREAFDAMGLNTNLDVIITSDDPKVVEIEYDGQYMLGADAAGRQINLDKRAHPGREIYINTDYPGGWKATSNASWLTLSTANGTAGGSVLTYNAAAFTGGTVARTGTITLQAGRLFMEIKVIQSHIADIEYAAFSAGGAYFMDGTNQSFRVKSNYDWSVKVEDEYNIISEFDRSGLSENTSGRMYNFTMVNNFKMQLDFLRDKTAKLIFYSENNEFDPDTVSIVGRTYFEIAGLYVYPYDQPTGQTWHTYANNNGTNNTSIIPGPGAANQVSPPLARSCAALYPNSNKWRLPKLNELTAISAAVKGNLTTMASYYHFTSGVFYSSATPNNAYSAYAYFVRVDTGESNGSILKAATTTRARCVRSK